MTRDELPRNIRERVAFTPTPRGCWLWIGGKNATGYGYLRHNGKQQPAHRVLYSLLVGQIPIGLTLDHLCRERACVNPEHMEPVTMKVNVLRGNGSPAMNARKVECKRGHNDWTVLRDGERQCRPCHRAKLKKFRDKKHRLFMPLEVKKEATTVEPT